MASRAAAVPKQPRGGLEHKNGQAEGRPRRVLRDIGNLATTVHPVEGKPQNHISRPITRNFVAQLQANNPQALEKKNKKPLAEVINGGAAGGVSKVVARKAAAQKKAHDQQQKPKKVIVISPDEELKSEEEKPIVSARKSGKGSSRKTLTSILTARSKDESRVHDYIDTQPEINSKMRSILIDWLTDVHRKFELMPESLYLTINIVDRYLSMKTVPRRELQLVGISSMLIACKYEEIWAPEVNDFIKISDNAYDRGDILLMEKAILGRLEWYLTVPTPYVFLVRYIKASVPFDPEMENMVFFLAELGMVHYSTIILYCPSMIAASAVYASRCILNKHPFWTETLKQHTGYSENQLGECVKLLVGFQTEAAETKLRAVYRKFSSPDRGSVALFPPAKSLLAAAVLS
ncbi:G2/mitotic-specific cyclin S13-7 isoform X2 [Rhododendron vialii]|uniref:G2/mitotic-specific cyclin S13-7 isoform X2 n=1 Tax=Rhododendron vialii TaxID=182163 RepID=UPI00265F2B16|nr:G2/mitotic-specific cyclin S13-7 isoform X2 [Rhododendron vialii]